MTHNPTNSQTGGGDASTAHNKGTSNNNSRLQMQSSSTTAIQPKHGGGVLHTGRCTPIKQGGSHAAVGGTIAVDVINSGKGIQGAGMVGPLSNNCNLKVHKVVISSDSRGAAHAPGSSSQVEASQIMNSIDLPMTSKSVISHASSNPVTASIRLDQSNRGKSSNNRAVGVTTVNVAL